MAWLHHILNHFPIALSPLAATLLIVALVRPTETLVAGSRCLVYLAAAVALPTLATGLLSAGHVIERGGDAARVALHRNAALGATVLQVFASASVWFGVKRAHRGAAVFGAVASVAAAGSVAVAGHLGGDMLHAGLAPWSKEPHHHGPAEPTGSGSDHAHPEHPAPAADVWEQPEAEPAPTSSALSSAAPRTSASTPASAVPGTASRPQPARLPVRKPQPAPAGHDDHSGHQH